MSSEKFENYAEGFVDGGMGASRLIRQAHDAEISALRSQLEEAKEIIRLFSGIPIPEEIETGWDCTNVTLLNCNIRRARSFLKENGNG